MRKLDRKRCLIYYIGKIATIVLVLTVMSPVNASLTVVRDPYCPETNPITAKLRDLVQASPHKATVEMGDTAIQVIRAYESCASNYKRKGNLEKFVYSVAQGAPMYMFASQCFLHSDHRADAITTLDAGSARIVDALKQSTNFKALSPLLRPYFERYRGQLEASLAEVRALRAQIS